MIIFIIKIRFETFLDKNNVILISKVTSKILLTISNCWKHMSSIKDVKCEIPQGAGFLKIFFALNCVYQLVVPGSC